MRIVAGSMGGRTIHAPKTKLTRPMTDKIRAALFDSLGDITNGLVLDAYAGTGAVGLEALSRGAARVIGVESARSAVVAIKRNIADLQAGWGYSLYESTMESWLARHGQFDNQPFSLIVADPPYEKVKTDVLEKLGTILAEDGVLAVSSTSKIAAHELAGVKLVDSKKYGDTLLSFYKVG